MKKSFIFTAKKPEQAIKNGLDELGLTLAEVEVNIISSGGFFKKAQVEIIVTMPDEKPSVTVQAAPVVQDTIAPSTTAAAENAPRKEEIKAEATHDSPKEAKHKKEKPKKDKKKEKQEPIVEEKKPLFAMKFGTGEDAQEKSEEATSAVNTKPQKSTKAAAGEKSKPDKANKQKPKFVKKPRGERAVPTEEDAKKATSFLEGLLKAAQIEATLDCQLKEGVMITILTTATGVIGHRGETLDCIQYLTSQAVNEGKDRYVMVRLDALGYREKRRAALKKVATSAAEKCLKQNRRVSLEPMNSSDRRDVHEFLGDIEGVITKSEGFEPNRRLVVYPARKI